MANALLQRAADEVALPLQVTSAGVRSHDLPVDPQAVKALRELGIDISHHVPRVATPRVIDHDGADLVLVMTRDHLRELVAIQPLAFDRTFTLLELLRRIDAHGDAPLPTDWAEWTRVVAGDRTAADLLRRSADDDVDDPYGRPARMVRRTARLLEEATRTLTVVLPRPPQGRQVDLPGTMHI
jgi:protein-tyrosine phosphatase